MKQPKIVIWDLETLPDPREIYKRIPSIGAWPGRTFKAELQTIMCFGYKIYGDKRARSINAWDFKESWANDRHDDSAVVQAAYDILHDADEIVTHNGKMFDVKVLNTRLQAYGMPPLDRKLRHVDTKIVAKRGLSLYSNSLADVAKFYKVEDKMSISGKWGLWERIAFKEESRSDLKIMDKYCKQDVDTLEQIYEKLRPFHGTDGVNKSLFADSGVVCNTCGSSNIFGNGTRKTTTSRYQRLMCGDCGSSQKGKKL